MSMSVEALEYLASKGLSLEEVIEFARLADKPKGRSAAAERQARYRARQKSENEGGDVTGDVTSDGNDVTEGPLSLPPNENNSNPPTHTPGTQTPARKGSDFPRPEWANPQVWSDFLKNRKAKRLPCTATAHAKLLRDIDTMADDEWPPGRLFEAIVARGWAAAHDPRENRKPNNERRPANDRSTATAAQGALAILEARNAAGSH